MNKALNWACTQVFNIAGSVRRARRTANDEQTNEKYFAVHHNDLLETEVESCLGKNNLGMSKALVEATMSGQSLTSNIIDGINVNQCRVQTVIVSIRCLSVVEDLLTTITAIPYAG